MKVSYNWLQLFFNKKLPKPEKLADLLTMYSLEVENLEETQKDWIFDIDVLPNRAHDCLSHTGIAREVAAITKLKVKSQKLKVSVQNRELKIQDFLDVEVKDRDLCPRYTAKVMTGVKIGPSPVWLQERLNAIGQKPINNVVDAANYLMFESGQPLHAFDLDKLDNRQQTTDNRKKIIVRRAKKGEKITTLDGEERKLYESTLVIADAEKPVAIAGIMGGTNTEVDKGTTNLILESAAFDQTNIRKSSRRLGIRTESSLRFEGGIDPNLAGEAIVRAASLIKEISGGVIVSEMIDVYPKKVFPKKIRLGILHLRNMLGVRISEQTVTQILKRLGFTPKKEKRGPSWLVEVPTYRLDVAGEEDLIEEVGRIYGYENIPETPPPVVSQFRRQEDFVTFSRLSKKLLSGLGYTETYNTSFVGDRLIEKEGMSPGDHIAIENPVSEDFAYLRTSLLSRILENISSNIIFFDSLRFFELGKVYFKKRNKLEEKSMLSFASTRKSRVSSSALGFYETKGELEAFLSGLGILESTFVSPKPTLPGRGIWHPKNSSDIKIGNVTLGRFGQINPFVMENLGVKEATFAADLDFNTLLQAAAIDEYEYVSPFRYPATYRDIAVLVPLNMRVVDVLNVINRVGGKLVKDVDLFDMYEGRQLPDGKKNLAFHIVYQSGSRTLTSPEVEALHVKIIKTLEKDMGWEVRA